jgi:hypothetical protein
VPSTIQYVEADELNWTGCTALQLPCRGGTTRTMQRTLACNGAARATAGAIRAPATWSAWPARREDERRAILPCLPWVTGLAPVGRPVRWLVSGLMSPAGVGLL